MSLDRGMYVKVLEEHAGLEMLMWLPKACCLGPCSHLLTKVKVRPLETLSIENVMKQPS